MKLVQKLPLGLSLAAALFMSSCSKEDIQNPQPDMEKNRTEAEMRGIGGGYFPYQPNVPSTKAGVGKNSLPSTWQRDASFGSQDAQNYPIGISRLTALWGFNGVCSFIPALPQIAGIDMSTFLSVTVNTPLQSFNNTLKSVAKTTIKGMTPGHKYEFTYYVACAVPEKTEQGYPTTFAEQAAIYMRYNSPTTNMYSGIKGVTNLASKHNQWIQQKIYFTAEDTEVDVLFSGSTKSAGQWSYVHLFVDKNSMKRVY